MGDEPSDAAAARDLQGGAGAGGEARGDEDPEQGEAADGEEEGRDAPQGGGDGQVVSRKLGFKILGQSTFKRSYS
mgnify:CR=1 FL=1